MQPGNKEDEVTTSKMRKYQTGVGKLLYLSRWSRPDIINTVRELSHFTARTQRAHIESMNIVMDYCVGTMEKGLILNPKGKWDGKKDGTKIQIVGKSDSDYAKDLESRRSVSGYCVFVNGAPVGMKSKMQATVTLSVTEAELIAATNCVQEMLYVKKIIKSIGLEVRIPMILNVDNKGARDLMNNWSVGGRTRHIDVKYYFLRDLKEQNIVKVEWIPSGENSSDMFTKNLPTDLFAKHSNNFCRE